MNSVNIMGRLTRDPEMRQTTQGTIVTRYTLAVNGRVKADYIPVVAFNKSGEFANKYFRKGMMVAVTGRLSVDSYVGNDGTNKTFTSVIAEDQFFCEKKRDELEVTEDEDCPFDTPI